MRAVHGDRFSVMMRDGRIRWRGNLRPGPAFREYRVEIEYAYKRRPTVRVLDPPLERRSPDEPVPHTFDGDSRDPTLCLYFPGEWDASQRIAETIVPWTAEWLLHYEAWLVTGVWSGGGVHLPGAKSLDRDPAARP